MSELLTVAQMRALILDQVRRPTDAIERLAVVNAAHRVLAGPVHAARDIPHFDNSAMDGVGVDADYVSTVPQVLKLSGTVLAGTDATALLAAGTCVRIMTGAPVPAGVTAVVPREGCDESQLAQGVVVVNERPERGQHIRRRGEDVACGAVVGVAGDVVTAARQNLLLASGCVSVEVVKRPVVCVLSSGDELKEVGDALGDFDVVNSNAHAIAAALDALGAQVRMLGIARDTLDDHVALIAQARDADFVLTIGGVSMGTHDFVRPALAQLGAQLHAWRVAMRPGKPLAVARLGDTHVFGLPGNPVSSLVSFHLFVAPALRHWMGRAAGPVSVVATLAEATHKKAGLEHYARGRLSQHDDGLRVALLPKQGSHHISALADADVLVQLPLDGEAFAAGARVTCLPL